MSRVLQVLQMAWVLDSFLIVFHPQWEADEEHCVGMYQSCGEGGRISAASQDGWLSMLWAVVQVNHAGFDRYMMPCRKIFVRFVAMIQHMSCCRQESSVYQ